MKEGGFDPNDLAVRTKRVYQAIAEALDGKRDKAQAMTKAEIALSYVKLKAAEGGKTQYLLFLGRKEVAALGAAIHEHWDQIVAAAEEPREKGKGKGKKTAARDAGGMGKWRPGGCGLSWKDSWWQSPRESRIRSLHTIRQSS